MTHPPSHPSDRIPGPALYIQSIQTVVPLRSLTQDESALRMQISSQSSRTHRLIRQIARQSGITKRHLAVLDWQDDPEGTPLYLPASVQPGGPGMGIRNAHFDVASGELIRRVMEPVPRDSIEAVKTLVTVSCTHATSPGLELPLFRHAGISPAVQRWNLGFMGCSAGLAALRLVHGLNSDGQNALICTCELSSLHFQYSDCVDQITANMLFADGVAAVFLSPQPSNVRVLSCRCVHLPAAADQMTWFAGDSGLKLTLSRDLPATLAGVLAETVDAFLQDFGASRADVRHWLVHPGGPQILESAESTLGLSRDSLVDSRAVLNEYGNMSSSTIYFVLKRFVERGESGLSVLLAFGPGLTIELALLQVNRD